jgi:hypothetical protein
VLGVVIQTRTQGSEKAISLSVISNNSTSDTIKREGERERRRANLLPWYVFRKVVDLG